NTEPTEGRTVPRIPARITPAVSPPASATRERHAQLTHQPPPQPPVSPPEVPPPHSQHPPPVIRRSGNQPGGRNVNLSHSRSPCYPSGGGPDAPRRPACSTALVASKSKLKLPLCRSTRRPPTEPSEAM